MLGFIYFLKNPKTQEVFYVGQTSFSLNHRLKVHFIQFKDYQEGKRNWNKRFEYLEKMLPLQPEICLIDIVEDHEDLNLVESLYIGLFKTWGFNLTNQTDGGKGGNTYRHMTDVQKARYRLRMQKALTGKPKPKGFKENMSKERLGSKNPMAGSGKSLPIVCFDENWKPIRMFKYFYEVKEFSKKSSLHSNVLKMLNGKISYYKPFGLNWKYLKDCDKQVQDIVQSLYENKK